MKKINILLITILLLLATACGSATSPAVNDSNTKSPSEPETAIQDFDRDTPQGAYDYASHKMLAVTDLSYRQKADYVVEVEGRTIKDSYIYNTAVRFKDGQETERSSVWTNTGVSGTMTGTTYYSNGVMYSVNSNGVSMQKAYTESADQDFEVNIGETSVPLRELIREDAVVTDRTITTGPFAITYQGWDFYIEAITIILGEDGLFENIHIQFYYYGGSTVPGLKPRVDADWVYDSFSYGKAEIEKPDGYENFPIQNDVITSPLESTIAIGVANEVREQNGRFYLTGCFLIPDGTIGGLMMREKSSVSTPSTLLMLTTDELGFYENPVELSPHADSEYFLSLSARPVDSYSEDTITIDGEIVSITNNTILVTYGENGWKYSQFDDVIGKGNYYCIYDSPGSGTVGMIIQQHDIYLP